MTKTEALKYLFEENIYELNRNTYLKDVSIKFEGDEFTVVDKENKVVLKDKLSNYDLDFESQKKFVLNVVKKITRWVEVLEDLDEYYFEDLIKIDNEFYIDILGKGDIFKSNIFKKAIFKSAIFKGAKYIKINVDDIIVDKIGFLDEYGDEICDIYNEYRNMIYNYIENEIKNNLDEDKIRVVYYSDRYAFDEGYYVDGTIEEDVTYVWYVDDPDELKNINEENIDDVITYEEITLYYSSTTEEEVDNAVKIIKNSIEDCAEMLVEIMKKIIEERKVKNSEETEETEITENMV